MTFPDTSGAEFLFPPGTLVWEFRFKTGWTEVKVSPLSANSGLECPLLKKQEEKACDDINR